MENLKRSYQSSGLDDGNFKKVDPALVLPPSKRAKYEFDDVTQLKSPYSVLTATRDTATLRTKYPLLSTHRIAQVLNGPAQTSTTPVSIHAEVVQVSTAHLPKKRSGHLFIRRTATWINPLHFSNINARGASKSSLLDAPFSDTLISSLANVEINLCTCGTIQFRLDGGSIYMKIQKPKRWETY